jgi:hypothetical protein
MESLKECHVGHLCGEFEGSGADGVQRDLVREFLACVLVAYVDTVTTVVISVGLDDGEVQGVLTGPGEEEEGRSPGELRKTRSSFTLR